MDFNLSSEQIEIQKLAREFNAREIEPIASQIDGSGKLPDAMLKKFAGLGLLGMTVPKKYGGAQASNLSCILAIEQLAYSGTGVWWLIGFHNSIPESINTFGSEEIKQKYLRPLCAGEAYASIQFTEEETGSDPRMLTTTSIATEDGYVINGTKRFSTFGSRDGYAVTYTRDEDGNCTAFIVEKNSAGYTTTSPWKLMGSGGMEAVDVYFENVMVPGENLLGEKGKGFAVVAGEVRNLAADSAARSDEIIPHIKSMTVKIIGGITLAQGAIDALKKISTGIDNTSTLIQEITAAMDEQSSGAREIVSAVSTLVDSTHSIRSQVQNQYEQSTKVRDSLEQLKNASQDIHQTASEQSAESDEIGRAVEQVLRSSDKNIEEVQHLEQELKRFKIDEM